MIDSPSSKWHGQRLRLAVVGAAIALLPFSAGVASAQSVTIPTAADARAAANLANDLAQCQLAASGAKVNGNAGISVPLPSGMAIPSCGPGSPGANTTSPATTTTTTTTASNGATSPKGACVAAQRSLTAAETSLVNDYEIALAKAQANHSTLAMTPDVAALIGCE